jgi:chromosome segregation and condensation protein ScpB
MEAAVQEMPVSKSIVLASAPHALRLPIEVVTQTLAILARKGSGKSFTARRLAEQLFKAGLQVAIIDPKGDQWGIRSAADGKKPGLGFVILGGEHGDLPLEVGSGELVARLVVEERVSVLLDLSLFRKNEVATFMTAFLENLYRLKAREANRTPVMLINDEADAIAPQKPYKGEERMLGAIEDIVRRGRQRGIGCCLVTQRSAVLNKNVLTQAQVMIAMRTIAPQDLAAMDAWIDVHGTPEQRATLMESLPSLPRGDAWVWSPGWPSDEGLFQRVHVAPIETFDSGATPKPGEKRVEPKQRADVDLEALRRQMAATVERKNASDPKLLARRVAELEAELRKKASPPAPAKVETKVVEKPILKDGQVKRLEAAYRRVEAAFDRQIATLQHERHVVIDLHSALLRAGLPGAAPPPGAVLAAETRELVAKVAPIPARTSGVVFAPPAPPRPAPPRREHTNGAAPPEGAIGKGELRILTAVAQHKDGVTREQIAVLTGYRRSSRDTYLQRLRSRGLVDEGCGRIAATQEGLDLLGPDFEPLPTGSALLEHWRQKLPVGERAVLEVVVAAYPEPVDRERISEATEYQRSSRDTYLQRLRSRQLVTEAGRGMVRAADTLFAGGAA